MVVLEQLVCGARDDKITTEFSLLSHGGASAATIANVEGSWSGGTAHCPGWGMASY